jgi:hypothetical protein
MINTLAVASGGYITQPQRQIISIATDGYISVISVVPVAVPPRFGGGGRGFSKPGVQFYDRGNTHEFPATISEQDDEDISQILGFAFVFIRRGAYR